MSSIFVQCSMSTVDQRGDGWPAASRSFFAFFLIVIITHYTWIDYMGIARLGIAGNYPESHLCPPPPRTVDTMPHWLDCKGKDWRSRQDAWSSHFVPVASGIGKPFIGRVSRLKNVRL